MQCSICHFNYDKSAIALEIDNTVSNQINTKVCTICYSRHLTICEAFIKYNVTQAVFSSKEGKK